MLKQYRAIILTVGLVLCLHATAELWYVNKSANPGGGGTSWATAFVTIEPAVKAAAAHGGGEVWIAAGVYDEERSGRGIISSGGSRGSLEISQGVQVYGGFAGEELEREQRDWTLHECLIDGSVSFEGTQAEFVIRLEGPDARLDGVTVLGGSSGVYARTDSAISNCIVRDNEMPGTKLGWGVLASLAAITGCTIRDNGGSGFVAVGSVIQDCVLTGNGTSLIESGGLVKACYFGGHSNTALGILTSSNPVFVESCIFRDNVGFRGGAVYFSDETDVCPDQEPGGATIFTNCVFANNEAVVNPNDSSSTGEGGAVYVHTQVYPECKGVQSASRGTEPYPFDPYWPPLFINCTFVGNRAVTGGALYWKDGSFFARKQFAPQNMVVANSIFWDNGPEPIAGRYTEVAQQYTGTFTDCLIEGGFTGTSILNVNPLFRDAGKGDYALMGNSPAIDSGRDTSTADYGFVVTDIIGNARGFDGDDLGPLTGDGSDYDIGAYEYIAVWHSADGDDSGALSLSELLRVIQLFNVGAFHCADVSIPTEDGYAPGAGDTSCAPHSSDYNPQDWRVDLNELLRCIQFYNVGGYSYCPGAQTEDGYCPGVSGGR